MEYQNEAPGGASKVAEEDNIGSLFTWHSAGTWKGPSPWALSVLEYGGQFYISAWPGNRVQGHLDTHSGCVCGFFLDETYTWAGKLSKQVAFPKWAGLIQSARREKTMVFPCLNWSTGFSCLGPASVWLKPMLLDLQVPRTLDSTESLPAAPLGVN